MPAPARVTLPREGTGSAEWWSGQLDWAAEVRSKKLPDWRKSLNAYRDELTPPSVDAIRVNIEYEKTEQKRGQLFFRNPELRLRAHPRTLRDAAQPDPTNNGQPRDLRKAVRIFREVLQRLAGPKGVDTKTLMDQLIFDGLCPAGHWGCKVGYERFEDGQIPIKVGEEPIPGGQPGAILGLGAQPMQPVYQPAPNVIFERYFASRISPARLLIPPDFMDGDYSRDADWLGHEFFIDAADAKKKGWRIPTDLKGSDSVDDQDRLIALEQHGSRKQQLKCREVFCYASRVYGDVTHPLKIRRLVFVSGVDEPVVIEDSKDQKWDERGRLVGGITTLPIKVGALRSISDSPYPPSDCRISRRQSDELSEFRTQQVRHRKKSRPMRWIDIDQVVDEKVKHAIKHGEEYGDIPVSGDGSKLMGEIARAQYPRENTAFIDYLMADVDRQWALGANQQGVSAKGGTTATEVSAIQQATQTRLSSEQGAVTRFWLSIMEHLAQLVQLYAEREDYVELTGEAGAQAIEAWDKSTVRGEFLFDVVPDSSSQPDAAADRDLALNLYNLLANDPHINREELVRRTLEAYGGDPDQLIKPQEPPPPQQPEPPRVSISIKGEDLNPLMPQYANILQLLQANGMQNLQPAQPPQEPTGPAEVVDRERLRMAEADEADGRSPGLQTAGAR